MPREHTNPLVELVARERSAGFWLPSVRGEAVWLGGSGIGTFGVGLMESVERWGPDFFCLKVERWSSDWSVMVVA